MADRLPYRWRIGDVFTNGTYRWRVEHISDDKAVLRSCSSAWATTVPLTFAEWHEGHRWRLEENEPVADPAPGETPQ